MRLSTHLLGNIQSFGRIARSKFARLSRLCGRFGKVCLRKPAGHASPVVSVALLGADGGGAAAPGVTAPSGSSNDSDVETMSVDTRYSENDLDTPAAAAAAAATKPPDEGQAGDVKVNSTAEGHGKGGDISMDIAACDSPMAVEASSTAVELLSSSKRKKKRDLRIEELPALTASDVLLLCDLFSTPFTYGAQAVHLLKTAHWLLDNLQLVKNVDSTKLPIADQPADVKQWYETAVTFHDAYRDMVGMVDKLIGIPNRDILYEMYHYVNDMRSVLSLVNSYIKWNGMLLWVCDVFLLSVVHVDSLLVVV